MGDLVFDELEDTEQAFVADIADAAEFAFHGLEARREIAALALDIGKDLLFFVEIEIGDGGGATNRVAAIGEAAPEHVGFEILCDGGGDDDGAKREITTGETLGTADDVWADAVMLGGEPFSGASETAHDFVVNHQDAVLVAQGTKLGVIIVGGNQ